MAISNIWTIRGASGSFQTFAELSLYSVSAQFITQAPDQFQFTQAVPYDADPLFGDQEVVTIQRDGVQYFKGNVTSIQRRGTGSAERIQYTISGPWWQLQNIIYQQDFNRYVDGIAATATLAKLIIGTDANGTRLNSGQVIAEVLSYAITALGGAALFEIGTIAPATEMPSEELNALSCAEVISRCLRWNPDIVAYFDYSFAIPRLNLIRRASLTPVTLAIGDVVISESSINPQYQLQRDGVVVQYDRIDTIDGAEQLVSTVDTAGDTEDPLKTLYLFFDLNGSSVSYTRQKVVSESIQASSANWWRKNNPKLHNVTGLAISNAQLTPVDDGAVNNGTSYAKQLISGNIADWMVGVGVNDQIAEADAVWIDAQGQSQGGKLRLQVRGTNADSKIYSTIGESNPAEAQPSGLAAAIWDSLKTLQYEGSVRLVQQDVGSVHYLAHTLNISGGRAEWAAMVAQIYRVDLDLDTGQTNIAFGPARHLGANDLFQLYRNVRTRRSSSGAARTSASGAGRDLPQHSPKTIAADDGGGSAGDGGFTFEVLKVSESIIKVRPGAINGVVATGTDTQLFAIDGMHVWLRLTIDAATKSVTAAAITAIDPGVDSTTQGKKLLATIAITDDLLTVRNLQNGLTGCISCGSEHVIY